MKWDSFSGFCKRKLFVLLLALLYVLSGCGASGEGEPADAAKSPAIRDTERKLRIVTTIYPPYDFAKNIGGEHVEVTLLLAPGMESHTYEPTPADIRAISEADLFIYTGSENDVWVDSVVPEKVRKLRMLAAVPEEALIGSDHSLDHDHAGHDHDHAGHDHDHAGHDHDHAGHDHDHEGHDHDHEGHDHENSDHENCGHDHGDGSSCEGHDQENCENHDHESCESHDHGNGSCCENHDPNDGDREKHTHAHSHEHEIDEHVWTSPVLAMRISEEIAHQLKELDPAHRDVYEKNLEDYVRQLRELDEAFRVMVSASQRKMVLFADRFPFKYLAKEYGLQYIAAFSGCSSETEVRPATVAKLIEEAKEHRLPVIFTIEFSNDNLARSISEVSGAKIRKMHSCHNLTKEEIAAGETYLTLMKKNLEVLREALH